MTLSHLHICHSLLIFYDNFMVSGTIDHALQKCVFTMIDEQSMKGVGFNRKCTQIQISAWLYFKNTSKLTKWILQVTFDCEFEVWTWSLSLNFCFDSLNRSLASLTMLDYMSLTVLRFILWFDGADFLCLLNDLFMMPFMYATRNYKNEFCM